MIEWLDNNRMFAAIALAVLIVVVFKLVRHRKPQPRKVEHEYFHVLWLWPPGSHTRWEAEIHAPSVELAESLGLCSETTHEEVAIEAPTAVEVAFCQWWLKDIDGLYELARPGLEKGWRDWFATEPPTSWRGQFKLEGFSVPKDGELKQPWEMTWYCEPANHHFSVELRDGLSTLTSIDG